MQVFSLRSRDNQLIIKLREGDESALQKLYHQHAAAFINWARKYYRSAPEEDIIDCYQEAFTTFYFQVKDGKVQEITASIKAYLFGVGKNLLRDRLKRSNRLTSFDGAISDQNSVGILGIDDWASRRDREEQQKEIVRELLKKIGDPCQTVLQLAFFQNYPPESIAAAMGYTSEATARVRKTRCLKQLGDLLDQMQVDYETLF